ncbi:MAG: alpha/beta hydrolase [Erysipelotrichaceae bacterium]|nr:alpha/beta hydrolase [Erysipelotrichaceae bacterium]
MKRKPFIKLFIILLLILFVVTPTIYLGNYYHASDEAVAVVNGEYPDIRIEEKDDHISFVPEHYEKGFIFYPGAKVEYKAYSELMQKCSEEGILCILEHMPANLALFGINKADRIISEYPEVKEWYIGGHSLGGVCAAMYLDKHQEDLAGLILLASYTTKDLSGSGLKALSITATNDGILNREKYDENKANLPEGYKEYIIEGGNHCQFADYGFQKGDNEASISSERQLQETAAAITAFIKD